MKKKALSAAVIAVLLSAVAGVTGIAAQSKAQPTKNVSMETGALQVHFINVGQGDAALIDDGNFEILIDGGTRESGKRVAEYIKPYINGKLDVIVATHEHEDHIGGLPAVFQAYEVGQVIDNGRKTETKTYQNYMAAVKKEKCKHTKQANINEIKTPSGATLEVLHLRGTYDDPNDHSVITLLDYKDVETLFTGDLTEEAELQNLDKFRDIDVLKAGHHGSRSSSSADFLDVITPQYVVISAGVKNSYGHPHAESMTSFAEFGAEVLGTFRSGDIVMTTDGTNISFNTQTRLTMQDVGAPVGQDTKKAAAKPATQTAPVQNKKPLPANQKNQTIAYVGNSNSKVLHKSTCSSVKKISAKNKVSLPSKEKALAQGYKACSICKP